MKTDEVNILLVEDDELDVDGIKRALVKARISNPVYTANDGVEALEFLRGKNGKRRIKRPFLVILDLNMPRMSGLEFLTEIRQDGLLSDSLVFVLTTSDNEQDQQAAYEKNVAGYILKDNIGSDSRRLINMLDQYWNIIEFPPETEQDTE